MEQTPTQSSEDLIVWADESWCYREDLHQFGWKSDDHHVLYVGTTQWDAFMAAHA